METWLLIVHLWCGRVYPIGNTYPTEQACIDARRVISMHEGIIVCERKDVS